MIYTLSKLGCLAIYALALGSLLMGWPTGSLATVMQGVALLMLVLHLLEMLLMRKQLAQLPGSPANTLVQTLLFGLLHWKPLLEAQTQARAQAQAPTQRPDKP